MRHILARLHQQHPSANGTQQGVPLHVPETRSKFCIKPCAAMIGDHMASPEQQDILLQ